jgi:hypothetical protein
MFIGLYGLDCKLLIDAGAELLMATTTALFALGEASLLTCGPFPGVAKSRIERLASLIFLALG